MVHSFQKRTSSFKKENSSLAPHAEGSTPEGEDILGYMVQSALQHASLGTIEDIEFSPSFGVLDRILVSSSLLGIGIPLTKRFFRLIVFLH